MRHPWTEQYNLLQRCRFLIRLKRFHIRGCSSSNSWHYVFVLLAATWCIVCDYFTRGIQIKYIVNESPFVAPLVTCCAWHQVLMSFKTWLNCFLSSAHYLYWKNFNILTCVQNVLIAPQPICQPEFCLSKEHVINSNRFD